MSNIRRLPFFWVALILITLYALILERTLHFRDLELNDNIHSITDLIDSSIQSSVFHYASLTELTLDTSIKTPEVLGILAQAVNAESEEKNLLREKLYHHLSAVYETLKSQGIKQLHFHLPNGNSFLRMHRPERFGDPLFSKRHSVYLANTLKKPIRGFEEGKVFNGYRFVYPLFYEGRHIGSVETSVGYDHIGGSLERIKPYHSYFVFKKEHMQHVLFSDELTGFAPSFISDSYLHEENSFYHPNAHFTKDDHAQNPLLTQKTLHHLNATLKAQAAQHLKSDTRFHECIHYEGRCWMILFTPIENIKKNVIGYIITYVPNSVSFLIRDRYEKILIILSGSFAFVLFLLWYSHRAKRSVEAEVQKNEALLSQVLVSEEELRELNETLEERIQEEIDISREKDQKLLQQSRLAAMGEMIGNIAHQWRQPLNSLSLLLSKLEIASEHDKLTKPLLEESVAKGNVILQQMSQTIDDFRNFFKPEKQKKCFTLEAQIRESLTLVDAALESSNITLNTHFPTQPIKIYGYPSELSQVILNLIGNAQDAILERQTSQGSISLEVEEPSSLNVTLHIRDNGGGIPESVFPHIFEPYFSTKEQGKGTGIGLYMSQQIIERNMNGTLLARNLDAGACFSITLPLCKVSSE